MKIRIDIAVGAIVFLVIFACGAVIITEMAKVPPMPDGAFTILDKRITEVTPYGWMWFLAYPSYQFQYTNSSYGWVEVPDFVWFNYTVGASYANNYVIYH